MEHSKRMRACYSYKRKETFLSLNKIVFRNTGREILQDLISIQFLYVYDHTFSLFLSLSRNRTMDGESSPRASRMPNASDTIKYERKYHVEILGGFSLESRSDLAMPSDGNPRYTPYINPLCPRRDETCTARGLTFTICRYPSSIKSLLHPVKISRVVRGAELWQHFGVKGRAILQPDLRPPASHAVIPEHTSLLSACTSVCLSVCHHGFVIGRFLTTDRAGSCSISCILICAVLRKLCPVPVPTLDKKSLGIERTEPVLVSRETRFGIKLEQRAWIACLFGCKAYIRG